MLICKKHYLTTLLFRYYHKINAHGRQNLVSLIREKLWIPDEQSSVRNELRKWIICFRFNTKPLIQKIGDLSPVRITLSRPLFKFGINFGGSSVTKCQHKRKFTQYKSYLCLFICMSIKAVHLEIISSLSAVAFSAALRKFFGNQGISSNTYSDNGRNFTGAYAYLKSLFTNLKSSPI